MLDHTRKSDVTARRLEVITETGRRRMFSKHEKARIVEEKLVPGAVVSDIARRHGPSPQQVFTWRRQARRLPTPMADDPLVVPAVVDRHGTGRGCWAQDSATQSQAGRRASRCDARPRSKPRASRSLVGRGADVAMIAAIVHALMASR